MKIMCVTGTRADYGIYRPLLQAIHRDPDLHLQLVVTGMHLLSQYGDTIEEVNREGFNIVATPQILFKGDSTYAMSQSLGMAVLYFADIFHFHQLDVVLLLGDRGEMLAAAIAAHYQNKVIVHLHGGEVSGSADDAIRHCISKLAHLHFVATLHAKQLLQSMGEQAWRITPIGSLRKSEIEQVMRLGRLEKQQLARKFGLSTDRKAMLFVMHPDSKDALPVDEQIQVAIDALTEFKNIRILVIGSNSDAGGDHFQQALRAFAQLNPLVTYYSSLSSMEYLYLLSAVDVMVGNSSSGIIESAFFGLPTVNIGFRQRDREHGDNVRHVPYDKDQISQAIREAMNKKRLGAGTNPYDLTKKPEAEMIRALKTLVQHPDLLLKKMEV